jgi:hypothetical protein
MDAPCAHPCDHFLPLRGRGILPAFAQHAALLGRQILKAVEVVAHDVLFIGRQRAEIFQAIAHHRTLLRRQCAPLFKTLACLGALLRGHRDPALAAARERRLPLGRQTLPLAGVWAQQLLLRG